MSEIPEQNIQNPEFVIPYEKDVLIPAGFLTPKNQTIEERMREVKAMKCKPGDILICTYPKSGTHWTGQLVRRLLHMDADSDNAMQASVIENGADKHESMPSPRILFSHLRPKYLPEEHLNNKGKIVLCLRNPKDATVSSFRHLDRIGVLHPRGCWNSYLELFMAGKVPFGSFVGYVLDWEEAIYANKELNVSVIYYEDLKTNGLETLRRLQDHLGTEESGASLQRILSECSFENLQQQASSMDNIPFGLHDDDGKFVIYRKGEIGDWKNYFTVAQSEAFDMMIRRELNHCNLMNKMESIN